MSDDELPPEDHALVTRLRALPPEGGEPDWAAMAQAISNAVGQDVPRPWWRRWQWLVPISTLAATAAAALLWLGHARPTTHEAMVPRHDVPAAPVALQPAPTTAPSANAMWLDGEVLELDDVDPDAFEDHGTVANDDGSGGDGILPATNLGWIDGLDDSALERAENWLDRKKT